MPGRGKKSKRLTSSVTPKKRTRKAANKPQSMPISSILAHGHLNYLDMTSNKGETENSALAGVVYLLIDIPSRLEATEHGIDELREARSTVQEHALHYKAHILLGQQADPAKRVAITIPR